MTTFVEDWAHDSVYKNYMDDCARVEINTYTIQGTAYIVGLDGEIKPGTEHEFEYELDAESSDQAWHYFGYEFASPRQLAEGIDYPMNLYMSMVDGEYLDYDIEAVIV